MHTKVNFHGVIDITNHRINQNISNTNKNIWHKWGVKYHLHTKNKSPYEVKLMLMQEKNTYLARE